MIESRDSFRAEVGREAVRRLDILVTDQVVERGRAAIITIHGNGDDVAFRARVNVRNQERTVWFFVKQRKLSATAQPLATKKRWTKAGDVLLCW